MYKIPLYGKEGDGLFANVDEEDYEWLSMLRFQGCIKGRTVYAKLTSKYDGARKKRSMHRMIMEWYYGNLHGLEVDHKDGNGLNNCKDNLRICSRSENMRNMRRFTNKASSIYKGVFDDNGRYRVIIRKGGIAYNFGHYTTERDAAIMYNIKAKELFGEFANLNEVGQTGEDEKRIILLFESPKNGEGCDSKYRGVTVASPNRWRAALSHNKERYYLGIYSTEEEAAKAYDVKAKELKGDKAILNFPSNL